MVRPCNNKNATKDGQIMKRDGIKSTIINIIIMSLSSNTQAMWPNNRMFLRGLLPLLLLITYEAVYGALNQTIPRAKPEEVGLSPVMLEEAHFIARDFIAKGK